MIDGWSLRSCNRRTEPKIRLCSPVAGYLSSSLSLLVVVWVLAACTSSTPPVVKIGLVAPFEGIYREHGYEALAAMRAAIAEAETRGLQIMPLALDMGDDPEEARRTVAKLMADPTVRAVVGPLTPQTAAAVVPQMNGRNVPWYLPFIPTRSAGRFPAQGDWAIEFVSAVARAAEERGSRGLALAGWNAGWPAFNHEEWRRATGGYAIRVIDDPAAVQPEEAVLWLGDAAEGANFFGHLRTSHATVPFWLATAGDGPVFLRRALAELQQLNYDGEPGPIYWATWLDERFESWQANHHPNSPTAYAVYRATEAAIAAMTGAPLAPTAWRIQIFQLQADGSSHRISLVSAETGS
jgi:hypothetical protein